MITLLPFVFLFLNVEELRDSARQEELSLVSWQRLQLCLECHFLGQNIGDTKAPYFHSEVKRLKESIFHNINFLILKLYIASNLESVWQQTLWKELILKLLPFCWFLPNLLQLCLSFLSCFILSLTFLFLTVFPSLSHLFANLESFQQRPLSSKEFLPVSGHRGQLSRQQHSRLGSVCMRRKDW